MTTKELMKRIGINANTEQLNRKLLSDSNLNIIRGIFKGDLLKG